MLLGKGMRLPKTAAVILTTFIDLVAVMGVFLTKKYMVERSVVIDAPSETIHGYLVNLKK